MSKNITFYLYCDSFSHWNVIVRVLSVGFLNRTQTLDCFVFELVSSTIKSIPNEFSSSDFLPTFSSSLMKKMFRNSANGSLKKKKLATQKDPHFITSFKSERKERNRKKEKPKPRMNHRMKTLNQTRLHKCELEKSNKNEETGGLWDKMRDKWSNVDYWSHKDKE